MPSWSILLAAGLVVTIAAAEPVRVLNKGVGGNTTKDGLARYERDVVRSAPDHLVLFFGVNDACNSGKLVSLDDFLTTLGQLVDQSPTRSIVLVTPPPVIEAYLDERHPKHPQAGHIAEQLDTYVEAIHQFAKDRVLPLADFRQRVLDQEGPLDGPDSLIRNEQNGGGRDGVHPNAAGYRALAEVVADALADRVKPGETVVCFGDSITYGPHVKGSGTAFGETYPAWLGLLLNRKLGLTDAVRPEDPPEK